MSGEGRLWRSMVVASLKIIICSPPSLDCQCARNIFRHDSSDSLAHRMFVGNAEHGESHARANDAGEANSDL